MKNVVVLMNVFYRNVQGFGNSDTRVALFPRGVGGGFEMFWLIENKFEQSQQLQKVNTMCQ